MRGGGADGGGAVPELLVKYPATPGGRAGEISSYRGRGDEEVMFLVFVGGPDWGGIEELFNLREGGGRIVGGRGRGRR